jgi:20S proteasome alpha/beta subunit
MKQWKTNSRNNSLVTTNIADKIFRSQKRKTPVTIIIGIICDNVIVMASDSQTTYNSSTGAIQRLDTPKISTLEFSNGEALVAQSGDVTLSSRAVEILTDMAKGQAITDYRTVADMAQKAVRKVKEELREQNLDCNAEQLHEYIRQNELHFSLMIAHFHDKKPYIYTIDFAIGIASKTSHLFSAIGCGSGIATYILTWFNFGLKTRFTHAMLAAIYAIEEVKKVDPYCGGKVKVGMIASGGIKLAQGPDGPKTSAEMLK